jgi:NitT/TauT family transport system substrate-binding protein
MKRSAFVITAAAAAAARPARAAVERPAIRYGISVDSTYMLPAYLMQAQTWKTEGLSGDLISFRGDAECMQALAGDSIDMMTGSTASLINVIASGQPITGFYSGFHVAGFYWYAVPGVKSWSDLRGKVVGVSTFSSLIDSLTRYVLLKHGLTPEKDVQLIQVGGSAASYQALKSNRIAMAALSVPFNYRAHDDAMTLLGVQSKEVAPEWPAQCIMAKKSFIAQNPNTITAVLRAHVRALRLAHANKPLVTQLYVDRLKYTPEDADRAYDEALPTFDERGRLPGPRTMKIFWDIEEQSGAVKEPWPTTRFLDPHWIDTFRTWAP